MHSLHETNTLEKEHRVKVIYSYSGIIVAKEG